MTGFLHVFVAKSVKFGSTEVSIAPIDAKFQDLSFGKGPGAWFFAKYMVFVKKLSMLIGFWNVFVTKSVGNRFHELSLGRNDRLGLGTSKIEVLAKNTKKNKGKSMIFVVFPACGVGFLTSSRLHWPA